MRTSFIFLMLLMFFCSNGQNEFRLERVKTIPENATVNDILVHKKNIFVATDIGLYQISAENLETRLISKANVNAVCHTVQDQIWASVDNRYIQNMATGETTNYNSPGLQVRDLEYSKGKIWIATNQGIITVITRSNELGKIEFSKKSGLPSNEVAFIHIDKSKQMWIGTDKGIVFINSKDKWKTYEKKLSMEAMHYNHEGLWLVSNEEMWVVDDFNRWYPAAIDRGLRKGKIRDITADSTGRLYMASEILVRYDPYDETIESYEDNTSIVSKVCTSVESDRDNRIWLGTKEGGLFLFGFAGEATTIEELVAARDKKIEEAANRDAPIVEERIVPALGQETAVGSESADALAIEQSTPKSSTASVIATSGTSKIESPSRPTSSSKDLSEKTGDGSEIASTDQKRASEKEEKFDKLSISFEIKEKVKCPGEKTLVAISIKGGQAPYTATWNEMTTKDSHEQFLNSGQYSVSIKDARGQILTKNLLVEDIVPLSIKVSNKKSPSALGRKDGNVKISVAGGTLPYSIEWSNGETGDRARRLENGSHEVTVLDANGCKLTENLEMKARIMEELDIAKVIVGQKLEIKNIYYDADSTEMSSESFESLDEVFEFLTENTDVKIQIGGHTNNLPPDEYCDRISTARAKSVAEYLYAKGVKEDRISFKGYGKRNPIASNETKEGRRRNQRVEIEIISK